MSKRKEPEIVSPPVITRFTRRRMLSANSSKQVNPPPIPESIEPSESPSEPTNDTTQTQPGPVLNFPKIDVQTDTGNIDLTAVIMGLFSNPLFTSIITSVLSPVLTESLSDTIKTSINTAIQDVMKSLRDKIDAESVRIDKNELDIAALTDENNELRSNLERAEDRIEDLNVQIEELEQYGRRNSLRFHNLTLGDVENTDTEIVRICKEKLNIDITPDDICRSHPVGRPNNRGKSQVICRLRNWKIKNQIYSKKKLLKNDNDRILITEDLTKYRQSIVTEITKAKRAGKVYSFWTNDGRIFIKTGERGSKLPIRSIDDLHYYAPPDGHNE
ncbi:hypothetical protein FSP39_016101 [Pinctada imbricata]|uniref:Uncharacterized protein n=2 Tax=Pinctada imbricata TaxID=66713 RepID=A0AA88Y0S4_PINIB|nr:hypothetical protein FSP39_022587 [Pinctada imbricata]KAK3095558.1 hypothetical protein FSP39_016101 [Pinctada imbricata]